MDNIASNDDLIRQKTIPMIYMLTTMANQSIVSGLVLAWMNVLASGEIGDVSLTYTKTRERSSCIGICINGMICANGRTSNKKIRLKTNCLCPLSIK